MQSTRGGAGEKRRLPRDCSLLQLQPSRGPAIITLALRSSVLFRAACSEKGVSCEALSGALCGRPSWVKQVWRGLASHPGAHLDKLRCGKAQPESANSRESRSEVNRGTRLRGPQGCWGGNSIRQRAARKQQIVNVSPCEGMEHWWREAHIIRTQKKTQPKRHLAKRPAPASGNPC